MRKNISKEQNLAVENESRAVTTQCGQTALRECPRESTNSRESFKSIKKGYIQQIQNLINIRGGIIS